MNPAIIPAPKANQHLNELLERVYYTEQPICILGDSQPIAWLVGDAFMRQMACLIEQIARRDPMLADTLSLSLDPSLQMLIERRTQTSPLREILPNSSPA